MGGHHHTSEGNDDGAAVLTFLGATGTVTGSKFLLDAPGGRVLLDCGLYQGEKKLRLRNWSPLPVPADSIDAVVLSHAHIDHCGYLPALVTQGFRGPVYCSPGTASLAGIVLPDSGHLHEEEARYANERGYSKHSPALPLYTEDDARRTLGQLRPVEFGVSRRVVSGVDVTFRPAGHILGSSVVSFDLETRHGRRRLVASGDLGRTQHPLLVPPAPIDGADIVLVESTYGDRRHDDTGALGAFGAAISRTAKRGGVVVIPAFAVDRTEVLLLHLGQLREQGLIPDLPVYVDSPMALRTLDVYRDAIADGSPDIRPEILADGDPFDLTNVTAVREVEASMELDRLRAPAIIVSASGMATGGRVLHHLDRYLPDHRACVILVGFQAAQTRGRQLAEGARQIKLLGRYVPVRAEVVDLPSFSVHADQGELLDWLSGASRPPDTVYVVHGEAAASATFASVAAERLDAPVVVPNYGERVRLD